MPEEEKPPAFFIENLKLLGYLRQRRKERTSSPDSSNRGHTKMLKAYVRDVFIAHREKENALVLHLAKRRKADVPCVIIAHRVKENIGYFTQRHKGRSLSSTCKEAQRPTKYELSS
jgi:hypothetical protein